LDIFRALADDVRLRVLNVLLADELSVAELVGVLKLPQSTVSRHLKPLRDAGFLETRREGTSIYYRRGALLEDRPMRDVLETRLSQLPTATADATALRRVLEHRRKRTRDFFDKVAGRYGSLTQPGGGWQALATALAAGFTGKCVADLGSGEGALALMLARFADQVTAVDVSKAMLREVGNRARKNGVSARVRVAEGDLEELPLTDRSFDAAFLSQALHHAARPSRAIGEAARILKSGGLLIVIDLARHDREWVREKWADQWLGFDEAELAGWMAGAGLDLVAQDRLDGAAHDLAILVLVGRKQN
jgi:ArsR family transcriptional regulator